MVSYYMENNMLYIVRAMDARRHYVDAIREQIPSIVVVSGEGLGNAYDTYLLSLQVAGNRAHVMLEDDSILTSNFTEKVDCAIAQHPNSVIQFFSRREKDITVGSRWDTNYINAQCTYIPAGYAAPLHAFSVMWREKHFEHPTGLDLAVNAFLRSRKEKYWIHIPSLVNHAVTVSLIDKRRSTKRQAKVFIP